ncbi:MAG: energy-coupling factor transporter transmembrane protein EcfT [Ruthenibacterium sp.]|jgi:hypothetical protein|nr:energy-coupling factor transporter transmembrane protein EcfT [Oscillospiraceae bacterium]
MIQERNFPTFLKKLTPAPKLWLALGLILSVLLLKNMYFSIAVALVSIIMVFHEKQITLFKVLLVTMTILFVSMYGIHGAMAPVIDKANDPVLFNVFGINYYAKGFAYASRFFLRVCPLMCALFTIFLSMDTTDLGATMCKAGIPYKAMFTFIDAFQVITLLSKDMEQIRDAQRARGLNTEGSLLQRFKAFIPIMVPVVANSIVKVQDQAVAMETKGFNSECKKTVYRELTPYKWDAACKWFGILLGVFSIAYGVLSATGVIPAFLTNIM